MAETSAGASNPHQAKRQRTEPSSAPILIKVEAGDGIILVHLPSGPVDIMGLTPESCVAELRRKMEDEVDEEDLPTSFKFLRVIHFQGREQIVPLQHKKESFAPIRTLLPDAEPEATPAADDSDTSQWRRAVLEEPGSDVRMVHDLVDANQALHELGRGAFGIVCALPDARRAVKTIPKRLMLCRRDAEAVRREITIHGKLSEIGVACKLLGVYEDPGSCRNTRSGLEHGIHLVMPRAAFDLHHFLLQHAPMNEMHAARICLEVLQIVRCAHEHHIMLLDVKPENFLFVPRDDAPVENPNPHALARFAYGLNRDFIFREAQDEGWREALPAQYRLVATDFGLSQILREADDKYSHVCGSPYYIAPEVFDRCYSKQVDLWSVGVILHELLTGSALFEANTTHESLSKLLDFDLESMLRGEILRHRSKAAIDLLVSLLQMDPASRPSADAACKACAAWLPTAVAGAPPTLMIPPLLERQRSDPGMYEDDEDEFKFGAQLRTLMMGGPEEAALGLNTALGLTRQELAEGLAKGEQAVIDEFQRGRTEDIANLHYVLRCKANADLPPHVMKQIETGKYHGGSLKPGDYDRGHDGMRLDDFLEHPSSKVAMLERVHVLALRLYTTSSYTQFNNPLRERTKPHPFAMSVYFLNEALTKLKAVDATGSDFSQQEVTLWRGMSNMHVLDEFKKCGGTELAAMSTTSSKAVAFSYAKSGAPLVFKYECKGLTRGCSIDFLSVYPGEAEFLYSPLTYICYKGSSVEDGVHVISVEPQRA